MAELEVAKHGKNVIHMAVAKEHGIGHKLREIALEIAIIVFAVSISIWFHSMSEHRHEQQQVKSFLLGLKADLANDAANLAGLAQSYHEADANYKYLAALDPKGRPDGEKFMQAYALMDTNRFFKPERSRFEGFKSAGKLTNIEDAALLNDILDLHQALLPSIQSSENFWRTSQEKLRAYMDISLDQGDEPAQLYAALTTPKAKRLLRRMATSPELYERYQKYIALSQKIIQQIDAAYPGA
ncbi:hypothetical protein GCM10027277_32000 [Pseudoduganella ginsengisoli]|uniref:Uncharacterized protein n=1 Tax=Pseudoduganella ginsengisoli TaxID=1462440 RepID=A0A6L6PZP7_9BURK|nr:hypothetical protein [Pseudoduganella ginsengisoli]MTW02611.1 hypothetical protein [Pseudoduganella ginsengisoli]